MGEVIYSMSVNSEGIITYAYGDGDFSVATHLLSEVGAPYQKRFFRMIVRSGWTVARGVAFEGAPYIADVVASRGERGGGYVDTSY